MAISIGNIQDTYFSWLCDIVCENRFAKEISYNKLLLYLHDTEFRYSLPMDGNRAADGVSLRYRFAWSIGYEDDPDFITDALRGECSVLEMMVALALKCEENIMDDPQYGSRTGQWFWTMVKNLSLGGMSDERFDEYYVKERIRIFLDRKYEPDGTGGLFYIRNCEDDLRRVEIWYQLCWYLDTL